MCTLSGTIYATKFKKGKGKKEEEEVWEPEEEE